jgi:pimeloyl-ACP methyl ester carboxylesterase
VIGARENSRRITLGIAEGGLFMEYERVRLRGARAKVCLLLAVLAHLLLSRPAQATAPSELAETRDEPGVVFYPSDNSEPAGVAVVLHGMCGQPANACRHFASQVTRDQHLICPRARQRCLGGGSSWPQAGFAQQIERAVLRVTSVLGERVDATEGRTLVGYSLGAFRALELAEQGAYDYRRVMLIGARIFPDQKRLREGGVERLLLSAGSWDMMNAHMQAETRRLARGGFPIRFLGLGPVGHAFTASFQQYLPEALDWLRGADS